MEVETHFHMYVFIWRITALQYSVSFCCATWLSNKCVCVCVCVCIPYPMSFPPILWNTNTLGVFKLQAHACPCPATVYVSCYSSEEQVTSWPSSEMSPLDQNKFLNMTSKGLHDVPLLCLQPLAAPLLALLCDCTVACDSDLIGLIPPETWSTRMKLKVNRRFMYLLTDIWNAYNSLAHSRHSIKKAECEELMLSNCGGGGHLRVPWTARRSNQSILKEINTTIHGRDWWWSWSSNILATLCEELTHWKRPWCWETLKAGGEGGDRGWNGWMVSPIPWTTVHGANSGRWLRTGKPGELQVAKSQTWLSDWTTTIKRKLMVTKKFWQMEN